VDDLLNESMNSAEGRLARILIDLLANDPQPDSMPEIVARLDRLMSAPPRAASFARVRLAADVSVLHLRLPEWTEANIVPLFDWNHTDAREYWSARKWAPVIGSPQLTAITKTFLLGLFDRIDVAADDKERFAEWLIVMALVNKRERKEIYPVASTEIRSALRKAGVQALSGAAHRLAAELAGGTPASQAERWRNVVGPVFKAIWPLDVELTSGMITFKLVQMLVTSGEAVREAAHELLPFVRHDTRESGSTLCELAEAPDHIFKLAANFVIEVALILIGDEIGFSEAHWAKQIKEKAQRLQPEVTASNAFRKLVRLLPVES
jgi:hypothetical protein